MISRTKAKLLSGIGFGSVAALVYLGVKHFSRGLIDRDGWMALAVAVLVGIGSTFHRRNSGPGVPRE